jgi:hypothetical protein
MIAASIVSIGVRSVAARTARVPIVAHFVRICIFRIRIIVMSASTIVPADLTVPAAETRSAARAIALGGARAFLIVVRRPEIGRLDGGDHQHGQARPPNQGKPLHCQPPDKSLAARFTWPGKVHFLVRTRDRASATCPKVKTCSAIQS